MAPRNPKPPPEYTRWKKGQTGNPGGRPATSPLILKFRKTTYQQFIDALQKYGFMTRDEIAADLKRPEATMFDLMFGNIVSSAAKGDHLSRQLLIDRLWGKLKESDININLSSISDAELLIMAKDAISVLQGDHEATVPGRLPPSIEVDST